MQKQQQVGQQEKMKEVVKEEVGQDNLVMSKLKAEIQQHSQQIRSLLTNEEVNEIQVNGRIKILLRLQTKFHNIKQLFLELSQLKNRQNLTPEQEQQLKQFPSLQSKLQQLQKQSQQYEPTIEEINQKRQSMLEEMNEDGWTDATQSQTGTLGQDGIMVLDDDMLDEMLGKFDPKQAEEDDEPEEQEENIDYDELQKQFVTGLQSDEDYLFGKHQDKFCVSVASVIKDGIIVSGGGDDKLHIYKFNSEDKKQQKTQEKVEETKQSQTKPNEQKIQAKQTQSQINAQKQVEKTQKFVSKNPLTQPFKVIPHTQTIDLVDISFDKENLFSLTQNQLICTNLKTFEHQKIQIEAPTQFTCHKQGGVFAIANSFNVEIFNIKGFKFYDSYCLDQEVNLLKWTLNGKQLVAACDNKLRIITPKTQEVTKVTGTQFHDGQITTMSLLDNVVFTGCIDGLVYATNLTKGLVLGGIPKLQATINTLCAAQNLLIVGPSSSNIYWYDSNKLKQLFSNQLKGSSTDIIQLQTKNQYAVGDIKGEIHLFDKRSPMEEKFLLKAGNTVHQLWNEEYLLLAACEDGSVRGWDLRKYKF